MQREESRRGGASPRKVRTLDCPTMSAPPPEFGSLITFPLPLLVVAAYVCLSSAQRRKAKVGAAIAEARPWRTAKLALVGLYLATLAVLLLLRDLPALPLVLVLGLSAAIVLWTPGFHDAVCGEEGVQRGWHARRFEELEEWRLIGDHLRFRLFGEWTSVPLPANDQPRIREKLLAIAPTRESRFND
jgi:hypothetical protein